MGMKNSGGAIAPPTKARRSPRLYVLSTRHNQDISNNEQTHRLFY
ncbi:hypothetical protein [Dendronalium phyllosphericum]|nr:hypothetical protein [Dendronalium phyllosphericum]